MPWEITSRIVEKRRSKVRLKKIMKDEMLHARLTSVLVASLTLVSMARFVIS